MEKRDYQECHGIYLIGDKGSDRFVYFVPELKLIFIGEWESDGSSIKKGIRVFTTDAKEEIYGS